MAVDEAPARPSELKTTAADPARIAEMLAAIGKTTQAGLGITRPGFSPAEREAHSLVSRWLSELGLTVWQDSLGNTIAERKGSAKLPAIGVGSHLDSVPNGGQFDGVVGVVGAIEMIRTLNEQDCLTAHPVRVVAFACEEGARFGQPCIGSRGVVGDLDAAAANQLRDADGVTLADAMLAVGRKPTEIPQARWRMNEWEAFVELHIEQGGILEANGKQIGIVDVVSGSTRLEFHLEGQANHSGGAPMLGRADALAAAAELVLAAESAAHQAHNRGMRITVGRLILTPNNVTTIPGRAALTMDLRDVDADRQRATAREIAQRARQLCERRGIRMEVAVIGDTSPVVLPAWLREVTVESCRQTGISYRVMSSGASHDSQIVNRLVPAAIIFVPSRRGLSHVPEEWTSTVDIAVAVDLLRAVVLRLDTQLATKS